MAIRMRVLPPYPCWIMFKTSTGTLYLRHTELLELERAVAEAKRQVLDKLNPDQHHEVDPVLAARPVAHHQV